MADKVSAGLKEEVFNAALVRVARQRGTIPRPWVKVSMSLAEEEHRTYKRFIEVPSVLCEAKVGPTRQEPSDQGYSHLTAPKGIGLQGLWSIAPAA